MTPEEYERWHVRHVLAVSEPAGHLAELASALHAAYVQVAAGLCSVWQVP